MRPLVHGAAYFAELAAGSSRHARRRPADVHGLARRPRRAAARRTRQRRSRRCCAGRPSAGSTCAGWSGARTWTGWRFSAQENRHLGEEIDARRRRVPARHAGPARRLAPPEVRRAAAPGPAGARRRLRRRHRPVPQPPRRRRARAATRRPSRWPRCTADRPPWHDVQLAITRAGRRRRGGRRSGSDGRTRSR